MKWSWLIAIVMLIALMGTRVDATPTLLRIGGEELLGSGRLPAIAADELSQPHVVADGGSMMYLYDRIGGRWRSSAVNVRGLVNSPQFYNPHIEIDSQDRAWISGTTWVPAGGVGIVVRSNVSRNPSNVSSMALSRAGARYPVGLLSIDPAFPDEGIAMGTAGGWQRAVFDPNGRGSVRLTDTGRLPFGAGGEKTAFWISKAGSVPHPGGRTQAIWHSAMGGYYNDYSAYINSLMHARGQGRIVWANHPSYPSMTDDGAYVRVVSDNVIPEVAYITCDFSVNGRHGGTVGVAMNIYNGQGMSFPPNNILVLDRNGRSGLRRFAPQSTPAKDGGAFVTWTRNGRVIMRYVPASARSLADLGPEWDLGAGGPAAVATDSDGNVHLAYNRDGQIFYRLLEFSVSSENFTVALDFTGDGRDNLATYDARTSSFYIQRADGTTFSQQFGRPGDIPVPGYYEAGNLRRANLAVFRPSEGTWLVRRHDGTIRPAVTLGDRNVMPVPLDYTGDGLTDMAIVDMSTSPLTWRIRETASGSLRPAVRFGVRDDIPVPGRYLDIVGGAQIAVYRPSDATWHVRRPGSTESVQFGWPNNDIPVPADYTGDGLINKAVYRPRTGLWIIRDPDGPDRRHEWRGVEESAVPVPGDYDGDGKADLALFDNGRWDVRSSETGERFSAPPILFGWAARNDQPVAGYFQSTNQVSVAVWRPGRGFWIIQNLTAGRPNRVVHFGRFGDWPLVGDFTGDGYTDFAVWRPSNATWYYRANTNERFVAHQFGALGDRPVPGDYSGDGVMDLAVYRRAQGGNPGLWMIRDREGGVREVEFGRPGDIAVPGKYTSADRVDIAVFRPAAGGNLARWFIHQDDEDEPFRMIEWGTAGDIPVPFDYTGNGILDIAIYRPSTGLWVIRGPEGVVRKDWGGTVGDAPFAADFDGDGQDDIAIYRNGEWHIRRSSDGMKMPGRGPIFFGGPRDKPIGSYLPMIP